MGETKGSLVGTGVSLGVVHVLTGPDHLSAIVTLSANEALWRAFALGVRWGIGHSTGLLAVGLVFILITRKSNADTVEIPERLSRFFETLVGVFMILLGTYGLYRARRKRLSSYEEVPAVGDSLTTQLPLPVPDSSAAYQPNVAGEAVSPVRKEEGEDEDAPIDGSSYHRMASLDAAPVDPDAENPSKIDRDVENTSQTPAADGLVETPLSLEDVNGTTDKDDDDDDDDDKNCLQRLSANVSTRTMSLMAGMIHGLAGPGGVLGVIPAVQLHDAKKATVYLTCFCLSSTLTMGLFAVLYGTCSSKVVQTTKREYLVENISSSLSIVVGVLWLTLSLAGVMDKVFP